MCLSMRESASQLRLEGVQMSTRTANIRYALVFFTHAHIYMVMYMNLSKNVATCITLLTFYIVF